MTGRFRHLATIIVALAALAADQSLRARRRRKRFRSRPKSVSAATTTRPASSWISPARSISAPSRSPIPIASSSICRRWPSSFRPKRATPGAGWSRPIRYGLVMPGGSRIVHRCDQARAGRQGRRCSTRRRRSGAAGARSRGRSTATASCARSRVDSKARTDTVKPTRDRAACVSTDPRPIDRRRSRPWRHRYRRQGAGGEHEEKAIVLEFALRCCATSSRNPANIASS